MVGWTIYRGDDVVENDVDAKEVAAKLGAADDLRAVLAFEGVTFELDSATVAANADAIATTAAAEVPPPLDLVASTDVLGTLTTFLISLSTGTVPASPPSASPKPAPGPAAPPASGAPGTPPAPAHPASDGSDDFDRYLLGLIAEPSRAELAEAILRNRWDVLSAADAASAQQEKAAASAGRLRLAAQANEVVEEGLAHMRRWRQISTVAIWILLGTLTVSTGLTVQVLLLVQSHALDGYQAALIVFVLAVVAISPATLLLLERPLSGIDKFSPDAAAPASAAKTTS